MGTLHFVFQEQPALHARPRSGDNTLYRPATAIASEGLRSSIQGSEGTAPGACIETIRGDPLSRAELGAVME